MALIVRSFVLSFGVFGGMILPILAITFISSIVWSLLGMISGGYSDVVSGPITATCVSLVGIRVALSYLGDHRRTGYDILILYSVLYGTFLLVAKGAALMLVDLGAVIFADWKLGDALSLRSFASAERSLQFAFAFYAISAKAVLALVMYTSIYAVMAVPMANAARAVGHATQSTGYFDGFGRRFIPLFCIFAVSFFLQFFFGLFTALFAILPLFLSVISVVIFQNIPNIDLFTLLKGLAASSGLLWLHSWIWAASAVALVESDRIPKPAPVDPIAQAETASDIRSIRKSRG